MLRDALESRARRRRIRGSRRCCWARRRISSTAWIAMSTPRPPPGARLPRRATRAITARNCSASRCSARAACGWDGMASAKRYFKQALQQAPASIDPHNAAAMLDNLALVEKAMGRYGEALRLSLQSLVQHQRLGDVAGEALCLNNLGDAVPGQGRARVRRRAPAAGTRPLRPPWPRQHARVDSREPDRGGMEDRRPCVGRDLCPPRARHRRGHRQPRPGVRT